MTAPGGFVHLAENMRAAPLAAARAPILQYDRQG